MSTMSIKDMREFIITKYPNWKKVYKMEDAQIVAIYHKLIAAPKSAHKPIKHSAIYQYHCIECLERFSSNNPEEKECFACGSKNIFYFEGED